MAVSGSAAWLHADPAQVCSASRAPQDGGPCGDRVWERQQADGHTHSQHRPHPPQARPCRAGQGGVLWVGGPHCGHYGCIVIALWVHRVLSVQYGCRVRHSLIAMRATVCGWSAWDWFVSLMCCGTGCSSGCTGLSIECRGCHIRSRGSCCACNGPSSGRQHQPCPTDSAWLKRLDKIGSWVRLPVYHLAWV